MPVKNISYLQSDIGMNHFFCGHITSIFNEYFLTYNTKSGWTRQIITIILEDFLRLWETHNKNVHGETLQKKQHFRKEILLHDLKRLYTKKDKVMFQGKNYLISLQKNIYNYINGLNKSITGST